MADDLEARLRSHARSFDSLLSLIPAKLYYGEDVSDQWKRKKQTPEQKKAAKLAKLDPENWRSAKDVMDERAAAAKRKREEEDDDEASGPCNDDVPLVEPEKPKASTNEELPKAKKRKTEENDATENPEKMSKLQRKHLRRAEKKAVERQAKQKQKEKKQRRKARVAEEEAQVEEDNEWSDVDKGDVGRELAERVELDEPPPGFLDTDMVDAASTASSPSVHSDIMSPPAQSASSSISSIPPSLPDQTRSTKTSSQSARDRKVKSSKPTSEQTPLTQDQHQQQEQIRTETETAHPRTTLNDTDKAAARSRLTEAISTFRTQRKADTNPRSRQQLLDQRRAKEEERRQAKKEQKRLEREAAARAADAEIEARFSPGGSGSLLGSPRSPPLSNHDDTDSTANQFSFGRIAFEDGSSFDPSASNSLFEGQKRKGPQDVQTALNAAKNKADRISGLDEKKRTGIEEKDMWLNAKKRAHGERVKDDTSLLKKALKRQQSQKKKSEKEWTARLDGVQKSQEARQRKRTENLAKRKEEKKHGKKAGSKSKVKVKRPGFEGSFRGRSGGGKKG